jgi:hypothetical protein
MYKITKRTPSHLEMILDTLITVKIRVTATINGRLKSTIFSGMVKSPKSRAMPNTAKELKILDPTTFPTAMPVFPLLAAAILTATSGKEYPKRLNLKLLIQG